MYRVPTYIISNGIEAWFWLWSRLTILAETQIYPTDYLVSLYYIGCSGFFTENYCMFGFSGNQKLFPFLESTSGARISVRDFSRQITTHFTSLDTLFFPILSSNECLDLKGIRSYFRFFQLPVHANMRVIFLVKSQCLYKIRCSGFFPTALLMCL